MTKDAALSHGRGGEDFAAILARKRREIAERGDLPDGTAAERLELIEQLAGFPLGRFLLENRGLNGYWTDRVIEHPDRGRASGRAPDGRPLTPLERQLLDRFPIVLATQERARFFATAIQARIAEGAVFASIPCGLMRDLLARDYGNAPGVRLVGIDIDQESLDLATRLAADYGLTGAASFRRSDAWALGSESAFDLIASNGLNIYEPDEARVIALYRAFFEALKPGGVLVTGFLTPPPALDPSCEWDRTALDPEATRLQKIVFADIIGAAFQCYRSSETSKAQLAAAGFDSLDLLWDRAKMFPTVIARKSS
ncbi:MAG: class I SAM-dependent methyltransferase [Pseudomonadota bacterium]